MRSTETSTGWPTLRISLGMLHMTEGQLADVDHALETADIHECAVVLQRGDDPGQHRTFVQLRPRLLGTLTLLLFEQDLARQDQIRTSAAFELGDAEIQPLTDSSERSSMKRMSTCEAGQKARSPAT
jgi:hypothetical protein